MPKQDPTAGSEMRERDLRIFAMGYAAAMKEEAEAPSEYAHKKANDTARFLQNNTHTAALYTTLKADWDAADNAPTTLAELEKVKEINKELVGVLKEARAALGKHFAGIQAHCGCKALMDKAAQVLAKAEKGE